MEKKWIFEGIKVADFTTAAVGPLIAKHLADHGATVVKVESRVRPDATRLQDPFKDGITDPDHAAWCPNYNTSKYGITLDMRSPKAKEIAWKLIKWCDVIVQSFSPGVMENWGMDYESVRKVKPDIIYLSSSMQGAYGPHAGFRGYGSHAAALAGLYDLLGWSDRKPSFMWSAYVDYIAYRFGTTALVAALDYRRRTGKGCYIEQSQLESAVHFIAPVIMDYLVNGRIQTRNGNRVPNAAPHGAYPCQGKDRWVAIAVTTDSEWKAFCRLIGKPYLTNDPRFQTLLGRKENEDELDRLVGDWTCTHSAEEVMRLAQEAGVSAGVVQNMEDLFNDPQMNHRGHFVLLDHRVIGPYYHDGVPYKLSKSSQGPRWSGPTYGQHIEKVCSEFLGLSKEEISDLMAEGVLE